MRKEQLQKLIENELDGIAYDIGFQILDCLDDEDDIDESDFSDYVSQELDSYFTYYAYTEICDEVSGYWDEYETYPDEDEDE